LETITDPEEVQNPDWPRAQELNNPS